MRNSLIHKDLRLTGSALGLIHFLERETMQRKISRKSTVAMAKWNIKKYNGRRAFIARPDGSYFRICIFDGRKGTGHTTGILWLHGGGYVIGGPEMVTISMAKHLLAHEDCIIVAPDYTLSAQAPYPAALRDCYRTLLWMDKNRESLGITENKFVVGGESAGGGLTAALTLMARDRKKDLIGLQIPLYPMIDDRDTRSSENNDAPVWNTRSNHAAWKIYLRENYGTDNVPPYAAPARAKDLTGLPPAISVVGTIEPFYEETGTYFHRLERAGIPIKLMKAEGCFHAFDLMVPHAGISRRAVKFVLDAYDEMKETFS